MKRINDLVLLCFLILVAVLLIGCGLKKGIEAGADSIEKAATSGTFKGVDLTNAGADNNKGADFSGSSITVRVSVLEKYDKPVIEVDKVELKMPIFPDNKYKKSVESKYDNDGKLIYKKVDIEVPNEKKADSPIDKLFDKIIVATPSYILLIVLVVFGFYKLHSKFFKKKDKGD